MLKNKLLVLLLAGLLAWAFAGCSGEEEPQDTISNRTITGTINYFNYAQGDYEVWILEASTSGTGMLTQYGDTVVTGSASTAFSVSFPANVYQFDIFAFNNANGDSAWDSSEAVGYVSSLDMTDGQTAFDINICVGGPSDYLNKNTICSTDGNVTISGQLGTTITGADLTNLMGGVKAFEGTYGVFNNGQYEIETEMATGTVFNDTINGTKYPSYTITIPANSAWLTLAAYRDEDENGVAGPYERFGTSAVNVEEAHIVNDMPWYFPDLGEPGAPFQVTLNTPEDGSSQTASYYKFTAGAHSDYAIGTNTSKEIKVYSDVEFTNELASCVTNVEMCRLSADLGISFADGDIIYFKLIGSGQYTLTVTSYQ